MRGGHGKRTVEVASNLMPPPCLGPCKDEGTPGSPDLPAHKTRPLVLSPEEHKLCGRVLDAAFLVLDGPVDGEPSPVPQELAVHLPAPPHERHVGLHRRLRGQRRLEPGGGALVQGAEHAARRAAVEPVDEVDSLPEGVPPPLQEGSRRGRALRHPGPPPPHVVAFVARDPARLGEHGPGGPAREHGDWLVRDALTLLALVVDRHRWWRGSFERPRLSEHPWDLPRPRELGRLVSSAARAASH
mmetsp:Transcript_57737/g.130824  ORF Transcript_57737/g.130824 Transcript_57737/m.130824 type:complete len:243 (+) Transcript_57737:620-1348(+)